MKYKIGIIISLLLLSCSNNKPKEFEYKDFREASQYIVKKQDSLIINYGTEGELSESDSVFLTMNVWIELSKRYAPGNILVRQLILQNLYLDKPNLDEIKHYLNVLSDSGKIWLEGYSYWLYVKDPLILLSVKTQDAELSKFMLNVDFNFAKCGYRRGAILYPPPFGDLRNEPIEIEFQSTNIPLHCDVSVVTRINNTYRIEGNPIGLNTHIPKDDYTVEVVDGFPKDFKFYEGYDKKYKSDQEELEDMLDSKRVNSIGGLKRR